MFLPVVLLLLGIHSPAGESSFRADWLSAGRHASTTVGSAQVEERLLSRMKPAESQHEVAAVGSWISGLPVQVDVKNGGFSVALKLRGP